MKQILRLFTKTFLNFHFQFYKKESVCKIFPLLPSLLFAVSLDCMKLHVHKCIGCLSNISSKVSLESGNWGFEYDTSFTIYAIFTDIHCGNLFFSIVF